MKGKLIVEIDSQAINNDHEVEREAIKRILDGDWKWEEIN